VPNIPINSSLGFIGTFLVVLGVLLVLEGLDILKVEKLTATAGRRTWIAGLVFCGLGLVFLWLDAGGGLAVRLPEQRSLLLEESSKVTGEGCLSTWGNEVLAERQFTLEVGSQDVVLLGPGEDRTEPFLLRFQEGGVPVGAAQVLFVPDGQLFRVQALVDASCQPATFVNRVHTGAVVMQNWDIIEFVLNGTHYALRLGDTGTTIDAATFERLSS